MAVTEAEWQRGVVNSTMFDAYEYGQAFIRRHSATAQQQDRAMHWFHRLATERW